MSQEKPTLNNIINLIDDTHRLHFKRGLAYKNSESRYLELLEICSKKDRQLVKAIKAYGGK